MTLIRSFSVKKSSSKSRLVNRRDMVLQILIPYNCFERNMDENELRIDRVLHTYPAIPAVCATLPQQAFSPLLSS